MPAPALPQLEVNVLFPATAGQFLELQPAWKSATCSPARNTGFAPSPTASAARRLISSISLRTHPTLEISISPSCAIQKIVGTLVSPYAFDTGYVFVSSSKMGNVMPKTPSNHEVYSLTYSCRLYV